MLHMGRCIFVKLYLILRLTRCHSHEIDLTSIIDPINSCPTFLYSFWESVWIYVTIEKKINHSLCFLTFLKTLNDYVASVSKHKHRLISFLPSFLIISLLWSQILRNLIKAVELHSQLLCQEWVQTCALDFTSENQFPENIFTNTYKSTCERKKRLYKKTESRFLRV